MSQRADLWNSGQYSDPNAFTPRGHESSSLDDAGGSPAPLECAWCGEEAACDCYCCAAHETLCETCCTKVGPCDECAPKKAVA